MSYLLTDVINFIMNKIKLFLNGIIVVTLVFILSSCSRDFGCNKNTKIKEKESVDAPDAQMVRGSCMNIPVILPLDYTATGKQANGSWGDFSCTSDVYTKDGVRVSPGGGAGRVWYDFGAIDQNKIEIILQWVDNGWVSDSKELQIFNWITNAWESKAKWSGNDGKELIDNFEIEVSRENLDKDRKIRIGVFANPNAVIHLNSIKVTY
jgi:hypothetical protein